MSPEQVQKMWLMSVLGFALTTATVYFAAKMGAAKACQLSRR
jgi:hypothetical protein